MNFNDQNICGTGTSHGIPVVVVIVRFEVIILRSTDSFFYLDSRSGVDLLIDTVTELRLQALRRGISKVDENYIHIVM